MKNLIVNSKTYGKLKIILDDDDYKIFKNRSIYIHRVSKYLYARLNPGKQSLQRIISKCPEGLQVDHINRNTLDNRKCNLRNVTQQENLRNQKRSSNTTGHTGTSFSKKINRFEAYLTNNYKRIHLGIFKTLEEAVEARKQGELKYWGANEFRGISK